ncbi:hypothetical protein Newbould305_2369 [Staphylococcus aureus subsp. aureus str. Newbould 305]|nr:hypothetical protein Newbould305_2369 [Staphylococcus aureus subsp. aureus str. Newbould 305]
MYPKKTKTAPYIRVLTNKNGSFLFVTIKLSIHNKIRKIITFNIRYTLSVSLSIIQPFYNNLANKYLFYYINIKIKHQHGNW